MHNCPFWDDMKLTINLKYLICTCSMLISFWVHTKCTCPVLNAPRADTPFCLEYPPEACSYWAQTPARECWKNVLWCDISKRNLEICKFAPRHEHGLASFSFVGRDACNKLIKSYLMKEQFTMTSSCGVPAGTSNSFFMEFLSQIGTTMM